MPACSSSVATHRLLAGVTAIATATATATTAANAINANAIATVATADNAIAVLRCCSLDLHVEELHDNRPPDGARVSHCVSQASCLERVQAVPVLGDAPRKHHDIHAAVVGILLLRAPVADELRAALQPAAVG